MADARPLHVGRPSYDAQPAGPLTAAVGVAAAHRAADVQPRRLLLSCAKRDLDKRLNPYQVGPATGLGLDHVFTLSVPNLWRETPAPYGPLFLWIGRGISALTGENIVEAVLCHRLLVLAGVGPHRVGHAAAGPPLRCRRGERAVAGPCEPAAVHASGRGHPQRGADAGADAGRYRVRAARIGAARPRRQNRGLAAQQPRARGCRWPCFSWAPC